MNSDIKNIPLSHAQKRIWYEAKLYPDEPLHNIGGYVLIHGSLNKALYKKAIETFVLQYNNIRLQIFENGTNVFQQFAEFNSSSVSYIDYSEKKSSEEYFKKWASGQMQLAFDLIESPLFNLSLVKISSKKFGFFIKLHHIIADGWSVTLLVEKINEIYSNLIKDFDAKLNDVDGLYTEYLQIEEEYLQSDRCKKNRGYWINEFERIPDNKIVHKRDSVKANRNEYLLSEKLSDEIRGYLKAKSISLNDLFLAAYNLYLYKTYQLTENVVGVPTFNRSGHLKDFFGVFTNVLPCRVNIDPKMSFGDFLKEIKSKVRKVLVNQKYPYDLLVKELDLRKKGISSLYDVCVNYYNTKYTFGLDGLKFQHFDLHSGAQAYGFQVVIKEWESKGQIGISIDYQCESFSDSEINNIYESLITIFNRILINDALSLSEIDLISDEEEDWLLNVFNETEYQIPEDKTVVSIFSDFAKQNISKIALRLGKDTLTYGQLLNKSNELARYLINVKSVKKGDLVAISASHSFELIIAILGIIKSGATYVPFDPKNPASRIKQIITDEQIKLIITDDIGKFSNQDVFDVLDINLKINSNIKEVVDIDYSTPNSIAYVIFTSGSTGKPKGVMISNYALMNYIWFAKGKYLNGIDGTFALYSSIGFDLTITSIFSPLVNGSGISIFPSTEDGVPLKSIMLDKNVNVIKLTPSHLELLKDINLTESNIKVIIVGGEDFKVALAQTIIEKFSTDVDIYNEYGPTETTVGCMIHKYDIENDKGNSVPIGIPIPNTKIYLLDSDKKPVKIGAVGEIYVAGKSLGKGYLNNPTITDESYVTDVILKSGKMYRTGDLAAFNSNRLIEYIGRADSQVKIRGFRIELKEIEISLTELNGVSDAVVLGGSEKLINLTAFVVRSDEKVDTTYLRNKLLEKLPEYMVPNKIEFVNKIPLTINGKVDSNYLIKNITVNTTNKKDSFDITRDDVKFLQIVKKVLSVDNISFDDNFFEVGGDSIKAIQLVNQLEKNNWNLRTRDVLNNPKIGDLRILAKPLIKNLNKKNAVAEGQVPTTPIIEWFKKNNFKFPSHYNQSVLVSIDKEIDVPAIEKAMSIIIDKHRALLLNFNDDGNLFYNLQWIQNDFSLPIIDCVDSTKEQTNKKIFEYGNKLKSSFNLNDTRLFAGLVFRLKNENILLLTAHHITIDAVSWRIILDDLSYLLGNEDIDIELLNEKTIYKDYAQKINSITINNNEEAFRFWEEEMQRINSCKSINKENDINKEKIFIKCEISKDLSEKILTHINSEFRIKPQEFLFIALGVTGSNIFQTSKLVIEMEKSGRNRNDLNDDYNRTVGWFTEIFPICFQNYDNLNKTILEMKDHLRKAESYGLEFGVLLHLKDSFRNNHIPQLRFNYLGDFSNSDTNILKIIENIDSGSDVGFENYSSFPITLDVYVNEGKIHLNCTSSGIHGNSEWHESFLSSYVKNIENIISILIKGTTNYLAPSDFEASDINIEDLVELFS